MKFFPLILLGFIVNAQNLVPNPSFELGQCPSQAGTISFINSWYRPINTLGTPDYFHNCASSSNVSMPNNYSGSQQAFEGNAYVGIITYQPGINYREYLQIQIITPLIAGNSYLISFYASLGEQSKFASNNLGAYFTTQQLNGDGSYHPINIIPNVLNQNIITDTSGWTLISSTYLATGNEQYLTIGNFADDASTQTTIANPNGNNQLAYYYIDNVNVSNSQMGNNEFLPLNVTIVPNPVDDTFEVISIGNDSIKHIELHSQYSKVRIFNSEDSNFYIKDLPSGIYFLSITFESNKKTISKVIKL